MYDPSFLPHSLSFRIPFPSALPSLPLPFLPHSLSFRTPLRYVLVQRICQIEMDNYFLLGTAQLG